MAHLHIPELALDHPERVFDLCPDARLGLLHLAYDRAHRACPLSSALRLPGLRACKVLQIAPTGYWRHAARQRNPQLRCPRAQRDDTLVPQIERVWQASMRVYGCDKVWKQMNREGAVIARCTVERLMKRLGLRGVRRGHHHQ